MHFFCKDEDSLPDGMRIETNQTFNLILMKFFPAFQNKMQTDMI